MKTAERVKNENETSQRCAAKTSAFEWESFISGNTDSLNHLYELHVDQLFNYGCQLCGDRELVKDAIQDIFHELLRYQSKLKPVTSVSGYLLKSLRRDLIKKLKKTGKNLDGLQFQPFEIAVSYEVNLIHLQGEQDTRKQLCDAINQLSPKQRQAVMLYFYEGYTYEEVAEIMDMQLVKSARKLIYHAIQVIRKFLQKRQSDTGMLYVLSSFLFFF